MTRLGLDYQSQKVKPDLVMLSSSNAGRAGRTPITRALVPSSVAGGLHHLTGYPDGSPQSLRTLYRLHRRGLRCRGDLAALDYKRRTGRGNHIDAAQYETGLQYLAPILLDYKVNGTVAGRNANRDLHASPGAYPCKGDDSWCALSVHSEAEWKALCRVMGGPGWAADEKFSSHESRKANEDELDRRIGEWTIGFTRSASDGQTSSSGRQSGNRQHHERRLAAILSWLSVRNG